jgi:tRNA pseudouridine55 synthase
MEHTHGDGIFTIYKPIGKTPKDMLDILRKRENLDLGIPLTYAGRLDPLAEGLLIVLAGDRVHDKDQFSHLGKTYEFSLLLGIGTDTHDLLGMVTDIAPPGSLNLLSENRIQEVLQTFSGTCEQLYPMYSSKTVDGVPLWQYAREGKIPSHMPIHSVNITFAKTPHIRTITSSEILSHCIDNIGKVEGDFRQEEIIQKWKEVLNTNNQTYILVDCVVDVSSGTYIRTLCADVGKALGVPALAYHIKRTRVGEYILK